MHSLFVAFSVLPLPRAFALWRRSVSVRLLSVVEYWVLVGASVCSSFAPSSITRRHRSPLVGFARTARLTKSAVPEVTPLRALALHCLTSSVRLRLALHFLRLSHLTYLCAACLSPVCPSLSSDGGRLTLCSALAPACLATAVCFRDPSTLSLTPSALPLPLLVPYRLFAGVSSHPPAPLSYFSHFYFISVLPSQKTLILLALVSCGVAALTLSH